eukprot:Lankesteria_metandrocarpae@DN11163_c0_g1_i1.p1
MSAVTLPRRLSGVYVALLQRHCQFGEGTITDPARFCVDASEGIRGERSGMLSYNEAVERCTDCSRAASLQVVAEHEARDTGSELPYFLVDSEYWRYVRRLFK